MKIFKEIFSRILALWALIVFISTMLIMVLVVLTISWMKDYQRTRTFMAISRIWMSVFFILTGVRRIYKGREKFKAGETYVVVCNHNTFMDVLIGTVGVPGANKTIAKAELANIPLFGLIYRSGSVLVDRKSEASRKQSFIRMKEVIEQGMHMCIYPEGTRNRTKDPLKKFHDGAFRLAVDTQKQIIPSLIFHSTKVMPPQKAFYYWPHPMEMHFLDPVSPGNSVEELKERVFRIMWEYYSREN